MGKRNRVRGGCLAHNTSVFYTLHTLCKHWHAPRIFKAQEGEQCREREQKSQGEPFLLAAPAAALCDLCHRRTALKRVPRHRLVAGPSLFRNGYCGTPVSRP